jgi:hypothetical protein
MEEHAMTAISEFDTRRRRIAVLDEAHIGDINGALGTIRYGDVAPRIGWGAKLKTLLAILGPGLIVMVGDNDAGAFGTYTQAGQNYGTTLLWTLMLLIHFARRGRRRSRFRSGGWSVSLRHHGCALPATPADSRHG